MNLRGHEARRLCRTCAASARNALAPKPFVSSYCCATAAKVVPLSFPLRDLSRARRSTLRRSYSRELQRGADGTDRDLRAQDENALAIPNASDESVPVPVFHAAVLLLTAVRWHTAFTILTRPLRPRLSTALLLSESLSDQLLVVSGSLSGQLGSVKSARYPRLQHEAFGDSEPRTCTHTLVTHTCRLPENDEQTKTPPALEDRGCSACSVLSGGDDRGRGRRLPPRRAFPQSPSRW